MEMDVIDTILADSVDVGDCVESSLGSICEVVKIEDDGDHVIITLDDGNEIYPRWDELIHLYGYLND